MKVSIMTLLFATLLFSSCGQEHKNPLLDKWDTPFETPPFDKITINHYLPAFEETIKIHDDEINSITNQSDDPSFSNTIEALDYSGSMLRRVNRIFEAMNSAMIDTMRMANAFTGWPYGLPLVTPKSIKPILRPSHFSNYWMIFPKSKPAINSYKSMRFRSLKKGKQPMKLIYSYRILTFSGCSPCL